MVQNQTALAVEMRTDEGGGGWGVEAHFSCSPKSHWIPKALSRSHALWKVWWENRRGSYSAHAQQTLPSFLFKQLCSFFFFLILICIPNPFNNKPGSGVSFVAGAGWAASGALKIPALGSHVGFGVAVQGSWDFAEMPVYISALAWTREQDGATAFGGAQGQLVKGQNLAPSFEGAAPGRLPTRRAQASFGTRTSSVTIPTTIAVSPLGQEKLHLPHHPGQDQRPRLVRLTNTLFNTTWLNMELGWPETCTA